MLRATEKDPRQRKFPLTLSGGQGNAVINAASLESVTKTDSGDLHVSVKGHMTLYVINEPGLYSALCRAMADCDDAQEQAVGVAAEAIK